MEMKKKKEFVVPGVLQVCEVLLEVDLLGLSHAVQTSSVETTGQQVKTESHENDVWSTTTAGTDFD